MTDLLKHTESQLSPRLFKLNVGQATEGSAVTNVTWCLTQELLEELRSKAIRYPYMLLNVYQVLSSQNGDRLSEYTRALVPLEQGMAQISFYKSGQFRIYASILWSLTANELLGRRAAYRQIANRFLEIRSYREGDYVDTYMDSSQYYSLHARFKNSLEQYETHDVQVPEGNFARRPPEWLWWYGNLWHKQKSFDQCHFKQRLLISVLKTPLVILFIIGQVGLRSMLLLFGLILGMRTLRPAALFRPFDWSSESIGRSESESEDKDLWWVTNKDGVKRNKLIASLLFPAPWIIFLLFWGMIFGSTAPWNMELGWQAIVVVCATPLIYLFWVWSLVFVVLNCAKLVWWLNDLSPFSFQKKPTLSPLRRLDPSRRQRYYKEQLEPLTCDRGGPSEPTLQALPSTHRTLRLRLLDMKARVCRPFAR